MSSSTSRATARRCRCGHLPTDHLAVTPDAPGAGSSFHLAPTGPCARCGASVCGRYSPAGGPPAGATAQP